MSDAQQSFEQYMEAALYGPHGFYQQDGRAGRRGDFITSPEVGPLFGEVIARFLDDEWKRLGQPGRFTVVEVGAGPGTLARSVHTAAPECLDALEYVAVELSEAQRGRHPSWVRSTADMPDGPLVGVVLANELLDNLPFELAVFDGGWRPARVRFDGERQLEVLGPLLNPVPDVLPATAGHGSRAPLQGRAAAWVRQAIDVLDAGTVLAFDYGVARTAELALRPWRDWLRTYRGHERGDHYLVAPGTQDITVDVCFDQLPEPTALRSQAQWLSLYGIADLVEEGRELWRRNASAPDLHTIRMRSRISEAEALLDPAGLGGFWALEWSV